MMDPIQNTISGTNTALKETQNQQPINQKMNDNNGYNGYNGFNGMMDSIQNTISRTNTALKETQKQQPNDQKMSDDGLMNPFEVLKQQHYDQNKMFHPNILSFELSHLVPWFDLSLRDKYMTRGRRADLRDTDNDIVKKLNSISVPWNMRLHSPMLRG